MTMPGSDSYTIKYQKSVTKKDIPLINSPYKETIKKNIKEKLGSDPLGYGSPLKGNLKPAFKLRVGDYRVVFLINEEEKTVTILAIKHRKEVYDSF